jgi:hypothetical protein
MDSLHIDALRHYTQLMGNHFISLEMGFTPAARLQLPHLEKLGLSINRLQNTLAGLPLSHKLVDRDVLHGIRNELSIIATRAQLLRMKSAVELGSDSRLCLQNIVTAAELFVEALKANDVYATS